MGQKMTLDQGRRPEQHERNARIFSYAVIAMFVAIVAMLLLGGCATTKNTLPFYDAKKYGKNPTMKCKNHDRQTAWVYRQWGHEGR